MKRGHFPNGSAVAVSQSVTGLSPKMWIGVKLDPIHLRRNPCEKMISYSFSRVPTGAVQYPPERDLAPYYDNMAKWRPVSAFIHISSVQVT